MNEDRGAVLRADVGPLAVHLRWIVDLPESIKQLIVADFLWIEGDLHDFGVAGCVRADIFLRGIQSVAAAVAHRNIHDARQSPECRFDSPKAAGAKCGDFGHKILPLVRAAIPF